MAKFQAPDGVTAIQLSIGPVNVIDGFIEVPDDLGTGDLAGLGLNGFVRDRATSPASPPQPQPIPVQTPAIVPLKSE